MSSLLFASIIISFSFADHRDIRFGLWEDPVIAGDWFQWSRSRLDVRDDSSRRRVADDLHHGDLE